MKLTAGSVFILGTLFLGVGGLIGGEIWVYSGSLWLATAGFGLAIWMIYGLWRDSQKDKD